MTNVRTYSDTKRAFHAHHLKPINSVYRRVVEEIMVEMHLLSVNTDFKNDSIYYLGVVNSFDCLMQGYQPEEDKESIFQAICKSVDQDPNFYREQAGVLLNVAEQKSTEEIIAWLQDPQGEESLTLPIREIPGNKNFKYSRLFAVGLYSLIEKVDADLLKDKDKSHPIFAKLANNFHLPEEKMKKDLDSYHSNLEKMKQLLAVMDDVLEANRKQREKRSQEKLKKQEESVTEQETVEGKETVESLDS